MRRATGGGSLAPTLARAALGCGEGVSGARWMSSAPSAKPNNPNFGSGPCSKRPGFDLSALSGAALGRSHRSKLGKAKLAEVIALTRETLEIPDTHRIAIVPASDTGAFEMAMWGMLGPRPVDCFHFESFGKGWHGDLTSHLKLSEVHEYTVDDYGHLPDLRNAKPDHDVVFTANGTTSGVCIPADGWDFISDAREGVALCDATSAVYAQAMPWHKLDVTTFSWQKVLGGEGAHGMLILGPRGKERLESFTPANRPLPKIFRMTKKGKLDEALFEGSTINTPSMMAAEDALDALKWVKSIGGLKATMARCDANLGVIERFVEANPGMFSFLAADKRSRSNTSVCLTADLTEAQVKWLIAFLDKEGVAYDIGAYRDAPAGLRIWCGATVETSDLEALMPWLAYAFGEAKKQ